MRNGTMQRELVMLSNASMQGVGTVVGTALYSVVQR